VKGVGVEVEGEGKGIGEGKGKGAHIEELWVKEGRTTNK
jgi:hypothetical protein